MKVKVANNLYEMSNSEYKGLLKVAAEQIPLGVYAIEKKGYAELCRYKCSSITELKKLKQNLRKQGFKVHYNG